MEYQIEHSVDFMWLVSGRTFDHSTISNFRREHKKELRDIHRQMLRVAIDMGIAKLSELCIDGMRIRANASRHKTWIADRVDYRAILVMRNLNCTTAELETFERHVAEKIELQLCNNSQYRYAIGLGQLRKLDTWILPTSPEQAWSVYESECRRRSQKSGGIKPTVIARGAGWHNVFKEVRRKDASRTQDH
jgi:hypothetical protein